MNATLNFSTKIERSSCEGFCGLETAAGILSSHTLLFVVNKYSSKVSVLCCSHYQNNDCLVKFTKVSKIKKGKKPTQCKNPAHLHGLGQKQQQKRPKNRLLQIFKRLNTEHLRVLSPLPVRNTLHRQGSNPLYLRCLSGKNSSRTVGN